MKLEIGKVYLDREGRKVEILKEDYYDEHSFIGSNGHSYKQDGKFGYGEIEWHLDLISEVKKLKL